MPSYSVRAATVDDLDVVLSTLRRAQRLVLHAEDTDPNRERVVRLLRRCRVYLVEEDERGTKGCAGACAIAIGPPTIAQIRVFAVQERWRERDVLRALLPAARRDLYAAGVETLAFVGVEPWLLKALAAAGFVHTDTVVTLQKDDLTVPAPGNRAVRVRPADEDDLDAILAIDEAAFEPLWRNTREALRQYLEQLPWFHVAELDGSVAGYQGLSLIGRHGHISRIAVHPRFQRQGIAIRLLGDAIAFYQRKRAFAITLNTQRDNARAQRLYAWFGFRTIGQEAQVMRYDLRPSAEMSRGQAMKSSA